MTATLVLPGSAQGPVLAADEPLSFWGGVDPATGTVIDVHHPLAGQCLTGAVLVLPGTRGSCSGSGVVLDLALSGRAPAALVFSDPEDVATLGALIAGRMFGRTLPVIRLSAADHARLARATHARITPDRIETGGATIPLTAPDAAALELTETERAMLDGRNGEAAALAMDILAAMAAQQGARRLIPVTRAHIDGCIYASPANLTFARRMADLGAQVRVPTTTNAISVDHESWRAQGVPPSFGGPAQRLADAYVGMGCRPSYTCAPYQHEPPARGEVIGWSESNAVIHANSVLGARTAKHPDFLDLCIAVTGRAPETGVYLDENRAARRIIDVSQPPGADDAFWPLLGWLAGECAPDRIPLIRGVAGASADDLRALCAAFGTTSAAPMLHVEGVTPEAHQVAPDADRMGITAADLAAAWRTLNDGPEAVELVALGSPHASAAECRALAGLLGGPVAGATIVTLSRRELDAIRRDGTAASSRAAASFATSTCWCRRNTPRPTPPSSSWSPRTRRRCRGRTRSASRRCCWTGGSFR